MKKLLLCSALALFTYQGKAQFNAPWNNDPAPTPVVYNTEDGAQYRHQSYVSPIHGENIGYWIYLPTQYMIDSTVEYSIIYWLHGGATGGLNENAFPWLSDDYFEESITFYANLRNSIIVYPNGLDMEFYTDQIDNSIQIETSIITELIPHVNALYNVSTDRACHSVAGFSMGGYAAVKFLFKYPQIFSHAVSVDGPLFPSTIHDPTYASDLVSFPFYLGVFGNDVNYLNANSVYTWADDYFLNNSNLPVNLMILAGASEPAEGYHATNFSNYLQNTHAYTPQLLIDETMAHDVQLFLNSFGEQIYAFQEQWICANLAGTAGLEILDDPQLNVYPNPSEGLIQVNLENVSDPNLILEIFDLQGRRIESSVYKGPFSFNLEKGVYLLKVNTSKGSVVRKVIIQ